MHWLQDVLILYPCVHWIRLSAALGHAMPGIAAEPKSETTNSIVERPRETLEKRFHTETPIVIFGSRRT
jgi:hypothetical protein